MTSFKFFLHLFLMFARQQPDARVEEREKIIVELGVHW